MGSVRPMAIEFSAYTATGRVRGEVAGEGRLHDLLETHEWIALQRPARWGLDGEVLPTGPELSQRTEDLLIVLAPPETVMTVHSGWHELRLVIGPYAVRADLPTLPGFDPTKSLARPSGTFVLLASASIGLAGGGDPTLGELGYVWLNRYAVERVESTFEMRLFFPGAEMVIVPGLL
jgi:hypothetical protein